MTQEGLIKEIGVLEEQLQKYKEELYRLENKELFEQMDSNIGKCFESTESVQGEDKIIQIVGVNKKHKYYKVNSVYYNHTLIGWNSFCVSYMDVYYDHISNHKYKEISKEDYFNRTKQYFEFAHQSIVDLWENK